MKKPKAYIYSRNNQFISYCILAIILFISSSSKGSTINVTSITALQTAINNSSAGDIIILKDATYFNCTLNIGKSNITVKSVTSGGVFLNGNDSITISGNNVTFSGFQFTSNTTMTGSPITVSGNSNTLTQLNFNGYSADHMLYITGLNNIVSYSNFQNKPANLCSKCGTGDLIQIIPNTTTPGYNKIQYCSFQHLPGLGGDFGNESIRIGNSSYSTVISRTIVEFCYFEDTGNGDSETISVKSMENVLRFNTMRNNQQSSFCFRNGNNNVAYSNFFINSGGIRIKQANNIYCYNNYFENCGDGTVSAPVKYIYDETSTTDHLNNLNFIHNTFVGGTPIQLGTPITPNNGNVSVATFTNNTWANNIFINTAVNIFSETVTGNSFAGNIRNGNLGVTIASGITNINPQLVLNSKGNYDISSSSPAIDAASSSYPAILDITNVDDDPTLLFDISGQARPLTITLKDVGCDEYSTAANTNHPLVITEVGPSYLGGPSLSVNANEVLYKQINITLFPNPATNSFSIETSSIAGNLVQVAIYNSNGQLLKTDKDLKKQNNSGSNNQYDISDLNNGIYFVKVETEITSKTMKLLIKK